jgi:hypothetical protein
MPSKWWASNIFKGRIGEAVVESILVEFGYKVSRFGYEWAGSGNPRIAPDLLVTHPGSNERTYVEVKYRSARPIEVLIEAERIREYRTHFPGTILAINSSWNGAIYCARVEDLPVQNQVGTMGLSMIADYWKPIWEFFPLVTQGDRLQDAWEFLREILATYGNSQVIGRSDRKLWDIEYETLTTYLDKHWNDVPLECFGVFKPKPEQSTLEELWQIARQISAAVLAEDLLGIAGELTGTESEEDPELETDLTDLMQRTTLRVLNQKGEGLIRFEIRKVCEAFRMEVSNDNMVTAGVLLADIMSSPSHPASRKLLEGSDEGVEVAYLVDQALPQEETIPLNLKTVVSLITTPCRINQPNLSY